MAITFLSTPIKLERSSTTGAEVIISLSTTHGRLISERPELRPERTRSDLAAGGGDGRRRRRWTPAMRADTMARRVAMARRKRRGRAMLGVGALQDPARLVSDDEEGEEALGVGGGHDGEEGGDGEEEEALACGARGPELNTNMHIKCRLEPHDIKPALEMLIGVMSAPALT
ncbi:hypothetical protein GUJ93_ZPchr0012g19139 [Zizania palustris]|uniref:Uncharacterized protein n=1 Tax=Zizania palustris TaxID=103762 RepID=A0A8J5WUQ2_ZIZPA|nr:hypothetical protein GUJ93_ZPchr0012g19139 [Zizania palustris]